MRSAPFLPVLAATLLLLLAAGCDSDGGDDLPAALDGTFAATTFTVTQSGFTVDLLENEGNRFTLDFDGQDVFAVVDATIDSPLGTIEIDEEATGTYELSPEGRLTFDFGEEGETILDQLPEDPAFTYDGEGTIRASGDEYEIVLEQQ